MYKRVFYTVHDFIITREDKFHKHYHKLNIGTDLINNVETNKYIIYSILDVIEENVYVIVIVRGDNDEQ